MTTTDCSLAPNSSRNPGSVLHYLRSFLEGRGPWDFQQECYSLAEALEDFEGRDLEEIEFARKILDRLVSFALSLAPLQLAEEVMANGHPGKIVALHGGDELLEGMVTVKLAAGEVIVPASDVTRL